MPQNILFTSCDLGPIHMPNRMVVAPMSRRRADPDGVPNELMAEYYSQRAGAGLIVAEAASVSRRGHDWTGSPGMYTDAQEAGWKKVAAAVHSYGGRIFLQLWHVGRMSHPDFHGGQPPLAPSAIAAKAKTENMGGKCDAVTPRALETEEIHGIVADFAAAVTRARRAGFDGVEIQAANGYLIDQFLRDGANQRTDAYGGVVANRARLLLEITRAACAAWEPCYVGVRLSPTCRYNDMHDSDPVTTFTYVARELDRLGLAYLHLQEALPGHYLANPVAPKVSPHLRKAFRGPLMINGGYDANSARDAIANHEANLVSFGMSWLANPDLVRRFQLGAALNRPDLNTLSTPGPKGYNDYPVLP